MPRRIDTGIALLADPTRRRILALVVERPRRPSVLARILQLSPAGISHHLRLLEEAGLISGFSPAHDRRGTLYFVNRRRLGAIVAWLAGTEIGAQEPESPWGRYGSRRIIRDDAADASDILDLDPLVPSDPAAVSPARAPRRRSPSR